MIKSENELVYKNWRIEMSRPICVCHGSDHTEMQIKKNGVCVIDKMFNDGSLLVRDGDLWECSNCGHQMINGFGAQYKMKKENLVNLHEHEIPVFNVEKED